MANPSVSLTTLRPDLAGSVESFDLAADRQGFIGHSVLPHMSVATTSGIFGKIPAEQLLKEMGNLDRAPGAGYQRDDTTFVQDNYSVRERGAEIVVDDREAKMYADYIQAETLAAARAQDVVLRAAEKRVADLCYDVSKFGNAAAGTPWLSVSSTPMVDVEEAVNAIYDRSGLWGNTLIMNKKIFRALRNNSSILDRIASSGAGNPTKVTDVTVAMLEACFDLRILVAGSSRNSAAEGQALSPEQIWSSSSVMVAKLAATQDVKEPCLGRTFHWSEDGGAGVVETYRDEAVRGEVVRYRHDSDEKLILSDLGQLITGTSV